MDHLQSGNRLEEIYKVSHGKLHAKRCRFLHLCFAQKQSIDADALMYKFTNCTQFSNIV